ncbi:MAG: hypothetical protein KKG69_03760 [Alphaproteobacteria bacterium]|jgi:hypothetical protein|uniref:DNA-binding protein n=1 Tax=Brevundimonas mediterranea TaxID=74329 RepID=A0A7Z8Y365_9CAUL|nr:hypothetical protein [Brevundimonas mediterranea]MBU2031164.1 hypothetical protein [Alphaproteobacteria bacterium]TAJ40636.1 MAG: hypothetical protein EPO54_11835 [Brevundimonas sp.]MBU2163931.1 hypothetical protein [Alphaproteobacteria bacterium]MBU2230371.1 hypothetical protein [Alphaproteobacteria bacterium]VDC50092.1 hypothetical protein BREV_BREV_00168 [Brevundimonas mediterranea]
MIATVEDSSAGADGQALLTRAEAAAHLEQFGVRLKPATLARLWSTGGGGPPCRHIRAKPFYPRDLLEAWAKSQISDLRTAAPAAAQARRRV